MMMTALELARLVARYRAAQRESFRTHADAALEAASRLEKQVDTAIRDLIERPSLFPEEPADEPPLPPHHRPRPRRAR